MDEREIGKKGGIENLYAFPSSAKDQHNYKDKE